MGEIEAEGYGLTMARALRELREAGVHRAVALVRHSEREFDPDRHDLEIPLTEQGRAHASAFGMALPRDVFLRVYASPVPRCMETAALALEGHRAGGGESGRHRPVEGLGLFYILDQMKMFRAMTSAGADGRSFLRDWFDGGLAPDIMIPPRVSAAVMVRLLLAKLEQQSTREQPTLDLCISHDISIFLLKDQVLGLRHEQYGEIEFLDGVALFEREGDVWMWDRQVPPVSLKHFLGA
jgi:broad specificity phosphatase PhoE